MPKDPEIVSPERVGGIDPGHGPEGVESAVVAENSFRGKYPLVWWVTLLGPFFVTALILLVVWWLAGTPTLLKLISTAAATFLLLGKFVILGGANGDDPGGNFFTSEELLALVLYLDVMTAWLLAFHLGILFKLPWVGKQIQALVEDGEFILKSNPWMRRVTFLGLVSYVLLPLAATGSVGGSIFGRLLGMSPMGTFLGTTLGNLLSCVFAYFFGSMFSQAVGKDNPVPMVIGVGVILGILWLLNNRYQKVKRRGIAGTSSVLPPVKPAEGCENTGPT